MEFLTFIVLTKSQLIRTNLLHKNTGCRTTAIANNSRTILPILELMQQSNQYPASRATKRVTQSNRTAPWIHIFNTKTKDLCVCLDDGGKSFVELPDGNVRL